MNRVEIFAFRVSNDERRAITDLAMRLQRSQSDAVRFVVVEAAKQLSGTRSIDLTNIPSDEQEQETSNVSS